MSIEKECIKLTDEDRNNLVKIIKDCLRPLELEIDIPEEYFTIHCWMRSGNKERKWDEYFYHWAAKMDDKALEFSQSIDARKLLFEIAWLMAWKIFKELELPYKGEVAENLWGRREELKAQYKTLNWSSA